MTIFFKNVLESLPLNEVVTKNLHDSVIGDSLSLSETLASQHKFADIAELLFLNENASYGGIHNLQVVEALVFVEALFPRVLLYDVGDILVLSEFANSSALYESLTILETLTAVSLKTLSDALVLTEVLTCNVTKNMPVSETLILTEGLSGYLVSAGLPIGITAAFCLTPSPLITGIIMQETPTGTIDGVNRVFGISTPPIQINSLQVFVNGILQQVTLDYTFTGTTITFTVPATPQIGDTIVAYYLR